MPKTSSARPRSPRRLIRCLPALSMALAACHPSGKPDTVGTTPTSDGPEALLGSSYYLVSDDDGTKPTDDSDVVLLFEPGGVADLYLASETGGLGFRGTYTYDGATVQLKFTDDQFHPDTSFALDAGADAPTLPFRVFSTDAGSSTWTRRVLPLDHNAFVAYSMAVWADGADINTAIDGALTYASAVGAASAAGALAKATLSVTRIDKGLKIHYKRDDGFEYDKLVLLFGWIGLDQPQQLSLGALATDPRVSLPTNSPLNAAADPKEKTAALIMPFRSQRIGSYVTFDETTKKYTLMSQQPVPSGWDGDVMADDLALRLGEHGYGSVQELSDAQVTVEGIIDALAVGHGRAKSPAIVFYDTHGDSSGDLFTGEILAPAVPPKGFKGSFDPYGDAIKAFQARLMGEGLGDLVTYMGGGAIVYTGYFDGARPSTGVHAIGLSPLFWKWLRARTTGPVADFSDSLVFMAACETDHTPDLRNAIQSRAYLAYNESVPYPLAGRTMRYVIEGIANHSHSVEEAFYNVVRVANTKQMVYCEDRELKDVFGPGYVAPDKAAIDSFMGYGWDGTQMVSYRASGWLSILPVEDVGSVWWVLFGGRWGQDAQAGWTDMQRCWTTYWSSGADDTTDPDCHGKNPGSTPSATVVDYASYLLTGTAIATGGTPARHVPRWTLNDGSPDAKLMLGCLE